MKYTIKEISNILNSPIIDGDCKEKQIITNFEYQAIHVNNIETAFFSISSKSWKKFLKRESKLKNGNDQINKNIKNIGLIITEEYIDDLEWEIPQIVVKESIEAMKLIAINIRSNFKNPVVAITGSMGKSSTRLMLAETLKDFKVLENRANSNTRIAILLQMCKLASNPEFAIFEVSLNAINNRGNLSLILKPNIAIITGIGSAHLSTVNSEENIAEYKSRIFYGLSKNGVAIINKDTLHSDILINNAKKLTNNIMTYSLENNSGTIEILNYSINKGYSEINLNINNHNIHYNLSSISKGMIENSLAVVLCLINLEVGVSNNLSYLSNFSSFKKVLEIKKVQSHNYIVTLIDDTHNASLPAMINAIEAFNSQCKYYSGNKIIAIGKISDLGDHSRVIHEKLIDYLEKSDADKILCLDDETRVIVNKVKSKNITWYNNPDLLLKDLVYLANTDSLILLKSSVTDTPFPEVARKLPSLLMESKEHEGNFHKSYIKTCNETGEIISSYNIEHASTNCGINPLLYYIQAKNKNMKDKTVTLKSWPTNNNEFYKGKEISLIDLIESIPKNPHPSLVYQLVEEVFLSNKNRKLFIKNQIEKYQLSKSSAVNVTGRYRKKERQSFSIIDLYQVYINNKYLFNKCYSFIFGTDVNHGFIKDDKYTTIFINFKKGDFEA